MTAGTWVKWNGADQRLQVGVFLEFEDEAKEWASVEWREWDRVARKLVGRAHPVSVPYALLSPWSKQPIADGVWAS